MHINKETVLILPYSENSHLHKFSQYYRIASIPASQLVKALQDGLEFFELNGFTPEAGRVSISSTRVRTYSKGLACVHCGKVGHFFGVERQGNSLPFHVNLYHRYKGGQDLLMTSDHIVSKYGGGGDGLDNRQTMCTICNSLKSNYTTIEEAIIAKSLQKEVTEESVTVKLVKARGSLQHNLEYLKRFPTCDKSEVRVMNSEKKIKNYENQLKQLQNRRNHGQASSS